MRLNKKLKICVFTAARSDYFLLCPLLRKLSSTKDIVFQLVVSGMHMSPEFGETWKLIEKDGFPISEKISMLLSGDSSKDTVASMGMGMIKFSETLSHLAPDICIILGDRFEMMSFATSCHILGIPIAHIHGGELTYGAFDDAIRHCITKMATLHFPAAEEYRKRIIQMGEHPSTVFNVGALAVENIVRNAYKKSDIENVINIKLKEKYFLVTLHPETKGNLEVEFQLTSLCKNLSQFEDYQVIWTISNADPAGKAINEFLKTYYQKGQIHLIDNLGSLYLSVLKGASAIIGNSSSAIIEAPILGIPTVNIGSRQDGRLRSPSIVDCDFTEGNISKAIKTVLSEEFLADSKNQDHPYGNGNTSEQIIRILKEFNFKENYQKKFFDINIGGVE